jgi:hypothetical protein
VVQWLEEGPREAEVVGLNLRSREARDYLWLTDGGLLGLKKLLFFDRFRDFLENGFVSYKSAATPGQTVATNGLEPPLQIVGGVVSVNSG